MYWFTKQHSPDKDKDSFHVSNGMAFVIVALAFSYIVSDTWIWLLINGAFFWLGMFYVRNVTMHCIIPQWRKDNPQLKLWYLVPLIGKFFNKK